MIRISILASKQNMTTWRLLVSDPRGWSAPSRWSDIIFDVKIDIIIIENLHLDIYEGILECGLIPVSGQPLGSDSWWPNIFLIIPRIIGTCKTVIKSFLKSIVVFLNF